MVDDVTIIDHFHIRESTKMILVIFKPFVALFRMLRDNSSLGIVKFNIFMFVVAVFMFTGFVCANNWVPATLWGFNTGIYGWLINFTHKAHKRRIETYFEMEDMAWGYYEDRF